MALPIGEELLKDISVMILNYKQICDHFGLSDDQRLNPTTGKWIIDAVKQYETSFLLMKSKMLLKAEEGKNVYSDTVAPLPPPPVIDPDKK